MSRGSKLISAHIFLQISDILQVSSKISRMPFSMKVNNRNLDYTSVRPDLLFSGFISDFYDPLLLIPRIPGVRKSLLTVCEIRLDRVGADVFWKHSSACNLGAVADWLRLKQISRELSFAARKRACGRRGIEAGWENRPKLDHLAGIHFDEPREATRSESLDFPHRGEPAIITPLIPSDPILPWKVYPSVRKHPLRFLPRSNTTRIPWASKTANSIVKDSISWVLSRELRNPI